VVAAFGDDVQLLELVLPDVAAEARAGLAVEGEAPGVAHAPGPDLRAELRIVDEGIVLRDRVRLAAITDVDAEDFAEQFLRVLRPVAGVPAVAAVAHADVEHPVRPEADLPAVVVRIGLI